MNKEQENIAEKVIEFLKECNGMTTSQSILNKFIDLNNNRFAVIGGLKDRGLITDVGSISYRLTESGWDFKSFANLNRSKILKQIKKDISFYLNIFFLILTMFLSVLNLTLTGKNKEITEKQLILEGELKRLDAQLNYLLKYETEISTSETIK